MWWPSPNWYEGHLTAAITDTAQAWVLADGRVGDPIRTNTYLLAANPGDTTAHVTFDLVGLLNFNAAVPATCTHTVDLAPHSRDTADLKAICLPNSDNVNTAFGGVIRSDGPGIVVERSTYTSTSTQFWARGASTTLTRMPPP